jgi:hypothetical protein
VLIAEGAQTTLVWEERDMPVNLLPDYGTGIQIHVEHLADYISGRELRNVEARRNELFPAYEALPTATQPRATAPVRTSGCAR